MKISVVMATYNGEKYVLQQLKSILKQSRQPDEVLICDDCSTDSTQSIVKSFIASNNLHNWKLVVNKRNKGWRKNFWEGILAATGACIFLCDQDDIWQKVKIEEMSNIMKNNDHINVLASGYIKFFEDNVQKEPIKENNDVVEQPLYQNIFNVLLPGCTYCVRKSFVGKVNPFWTSDTAHDEILWRFSLFSGSLYIYRKNMIFWRKHKDSAWSIQGQNSKNRVAKIKWTEFANDHLNRLEKYLKDNNINNKEKYDLICSNRKWLQDRKKLLKTKKIKYAIRLLGQTEYYNSFKQYLGDIYITYFAK